MRAGQFKCSAAKVARPTAVRPSMSRKSLLQAKWRGQCWRRGLNNGTDRPVCGSRACVLSYLWPLHAGQAQANSAAELPAPRTRGKTCSQTKGAHEKLAGCWQYSQRLPARSRTCRRTPRGIALRAMRAALAGEFRLHLLHGSALALGQCHQRFGPCGIDPLGLLSQGLVVG